MREVVLPDKIVGIQDDNALTTRFGDAEIARSTEIAKGIIKNMATRITTITFEIFDSF